MLMQQELREPAIYNSIVTAIASGASRLNEISTKINEDSPKVSKYLQTLLGLQIINKKYPFDDNPENSRRGIYEIADNCYNFWYSFIFSSRPEIESGNGELLAEEEVFSERLSVYIGKQAFEAICLQYFIRANREKKLPFQATSFGCWWGADPVEKTQTDFDVLAANRMSKQIAIGECKWKNHIEDVAEIKKLMSKEHILREYPDRYYYLFSKTPFEKEAKKLESERIKLVTTDMLFEL
jgi:AAA+ ATPase superfamily predicted ATPase